MIKGERKKDLTAEEILKRISAYMIYRKFFGEFKLNELTYNHLRGENTRGNPSFIIGNRYGDISHYDFSASSEWRGDCFNFVMQAFKCSYDEALRIIDREFGLGIVSNENLGIYKEIKKQTKEPEELGKRYSLIQMVTRKFTKEELKYWSEYYQGEDDLRREHVYSIKEMFLNKRRLHLGDDLRFGYLAPELGCWKLYRPHQTKKNKWISNVPITYLEGKENISDCCMAFITKSRKDRLVLQKIYPNVCSTQNESISAFSEENVSFIKANSSKQIIIFDNDEAGKKASIEITNLLDMGYCNLPNKFLAEGLSDFADYAREYGIEYVKKYLKSKKLI